MDAFKHLKNYEGLFSSPFLVTRLFIISKTDFLSLFYFPVKMTAVPAEVVDRQMFERETKPFEELKKKHPENSYDFLLLVLRIPQALKSSV